MKIPIYQVDAFTSEVFSGNPAAVCPLRDWIDDRLLQGIASENNLSETAFFVIRDGGAIELRWFTPAIEVALCGHATLASAFILFERLGWKNSEIFFDTRMSGRLVVRKKSGLYEMDFPSRPPKPDVIPVGLDVALGADLHEVLSSEEDLLAVVGSENEVRALAPDFGALDRIDRRGIIVTAGGNECDFVSRFFAPRVGVPEDPVTGSAHCVLIPYWKEKLGKSEFRALQVSRRGGELFCRDKGLRVMISGHAVLFMQGEIELG
jgi:PhzF family phenazine biosynthesis protein